MQFGLAIIIVTITIMVGAVAQRVFGTDMLVLYIMLNGIGLILRHYELRREQYDQARDQSHHE